MGSMLAARLAGMNPASADGNNTTSECDIQITAQNPIRTRLYVRHRTQVENRVHILSEAGMTSFSQALKAGS